MSCPPAIAFTWSLILSVVALSGILTYLLDRGDDALRRRLCGPMGER